MPKQIDHEAYREELAHRAAPLFSERGYAGLGMRAIAEALGVSKSALYHYFPTKHELFLACTRHVTPEPDAPLPPGDTPAAQLVAWAEALVPVFPAELALMQDYLRRKEPAEIAEDAAMRLALERFEGQAERIAPGHGRAALTLVFGTLLASHWSGGRWSPSALEASFAALLTAS